MWEYKIAEEILERWACVEKNSILKKQKFIKIIDEKFPKILLEFLCDLIYLRGVKSKYQNSEQRLKIMSSAEKSDLWQSLHMLFAMCNVC